MGRIKTTAIKRVTHEILEKHKEMFSDDFEHNKQTLITVCDVESKKIRNNIAGYITRLVKKGLDKVML